VDLSFRRLSGEDTNDDESSNKSMQVISLKWRDITSGLHGRYDGTVNHHMRPHGCGTFTADNNGESLEGQWEDGVIVEGVKSPPTTTAFNNAAMNGNEFANTAESCATNFHNSSVSLSDYLDAQQPPKSRRSKAKKVCDSSSTLQSSSSSSSLDVEKQQFYYLGETLRSPQHKIELPSFEDTIQSVYALQIADFAFVKRSSGDWSFCQLVERENNAEGEDVMTFCVDEAGHRKTLRPCRWVKMVRSCSNGITVRPGGAVIYGS